MSEFEVELRELLSLYSGEDPEELFNVLIKIVCDLDDIILEKEKIDEE